MHTNASAARASELISSVFHGTVLALAFVLDAGGRSNTHILRSTYNEGLQVARGLRFLLEICVFVGAAEVLDRKGAQVRRPIPQVYCSLLKG